MYSEVQHLDIMLKNSYGVTLNTFHRRLVQSLVLLYKSSVCNSGVPYPRDSNAMHTEEYKDRLSVKFVSVLRSSWTSIPQSSMNCISLWRSRITDFILLSIIFLVLPQAYSVERYVPAPSPRPWPPASLIRSLVLSLHPFITSLLRCLPTWSILLKYQSSSTLPSCLNVSKARSQ